MIYRINVCQIELKAWINLLGKVHCLDLFDYYTGGDFLDGEGLKPGEVIDYFKPGEVIDFYFESYGGELASNASFVVFIFIYVPLFYY